jgi:hypothetical protein
MDDQAEMQSVEDRLIGLLSAEDSDGSEVTEDQEDQEAETEEVEGEETDEDSKEEPEPVTKLKLTRNGEEIEVDLEEAKNLAQQGYDYTQKTQKLADERRQVEMQTQALKAQEDALRQSAQTQQAFIKDIAKVTSIDEQIAQYEAVDWNALSDNDPVQAQKLYIQYQQLQNKRTQTLTEMQQKKQYLDQQAEIQSNSRLEKAKAELLEAFPNWNADMAREIRESGKSYGFSDDELSTVVDPRMVKVLHEAAQYRKLQAQKGAVEKKVTGKPSVVKPGAKDSGASVKSKDNQLRQQLKRSGRYEDAAALIERTLK